MREVRSAASGPTIKIISRGLVQGQQRACFCCSALSPTGDLPLEALAGSSAAKEPPPTNSLIPADFYNFDNSGLAVEIKAGENPVWEIDLGK